MGKQKITKKRREILDGLHAVFYSNGVAAQEFDDPQFLEELFHEIIGQTGNIPKEKIEKAFNKALEDWFD